MGERKAGRLVRQRQNQTAVKTKGGGDGKRSAINLESDAGKSQAKGGGGSEPTREEVVKTIGRNRGTVSA